MMTIDSEMQTRRLASRAEHDGRNTIPIDGVCETASAEACAQQVNETLSISISAPHAGGVLAS